MTVDDKTKAAEQLANILREVNNGCTYVLSAREAAKLLPAIVQGSETVASTADRLTYFANYAGLKCVYDPAFDEYSLSKIAARPTREAWEY